jgi:acyl-CoA synthetase (AMP-forming)/AMP-acid ligase II
MTSTVPSPTRRERGRVGGATVDVVAWMNDPSPTAGIHALIDGQWQFTSYAALAARAWGIAAQLVDAGVPEGALVGLAYADAAELAAAFFGVMCAGATPFVLPGAGPTGTSLAEHLGPILAAAEPAAVCCGNDLEPALASATRAAGCRAPLVTLAKLDADRPVVRTPAPFALMQFSSGTTRRPRAVRITRANLAANLAAILHAEGARADDASASWLPWHHDMGLVGSLLKSICAGQTTWQMQPRQYLLDPFCWLECFGVHGATVTMAPGFGYAYAARRVRPERLARMDFSGWRTAIVGAEPIVATDLRAFSALLAPHGFRASALQPAYGLAEATLGVTAARSTRRPRLVKPAWDALRMGQQVPIVALRGLEDAPPSDLANYLVSCGEPLAGMTVEIVDAQGRTVSDGVLGEIAVSGPSVATSAITTDARAEARADFRFLTSDAGFLVNGELVVVGRMNDSVKLRGRHVYVEHLEILITQALGLPRSRCVVVPDPRVPGPALAIFIELDEGDWRRDVTDVLRRDIGGAVRLDVLAVARHTIPHTTSGKPRRRELWSRLLANVPERPAVVA